MAITRTQLTQNSNASNLAAYDTGTVTPATGGLVLILLRTHYTASGAPTITVTSNTGLSLTFSQIKQTDFHTIAAPTDTVAIYGALAGSTPGSGSIHVAISKTCSGLIWEVIQLQGVDTSGGTVASCVQQTGSGSSDTAGTTMTDTFGSAVNTNNGVFSCGGINNKNAPTATWNNSFTKDVDVGSGESTAYDLTTGHILSGFTSTSHTVTVTSGIWGIAGAEIKTTTGTLFTQSISGTLSFTGTLTKRDNKKITGTLSFTGTTTKLTKIPLSGTLSFTGVLHKMTKIPLSGTLSFTGSLSKVKVALKSLSGTLSFVGTLTKKALKSLSGTLGLTGTIKRQTRVPISGTLPLVGKLTKQTRIPLTGTISFTGLLTAAHRMFKSLAGTLGFTGLVTPVKGGPVTPGTDNSITNVTKPTRLVDIQRVKDVH